MVGRKFPSHRRSKSLKPAFAQRNEPRRSSAAKLVTKYEARRIVSNIAKLPELLRRTESELHRRVPVVMSANDPKRTSPQPVRRFPPPWSVEIAPGYELL